MELSNIGTKPHLIVIVGPTAVGKSQLAVDLAHNFAAEVISADSRQFYRELKIGTAKPSHQQLDEVMHHFIDSHSIHDYYNAGLFEKDVIQLLSSLFQSNRLAIMVGGSGMYIDAVLRGFSDMPQVPQMVRDRLNDQLKQKGLANLARSLKEKDEDYFSSIDPANTQRVIRALEVIEHTGKKFSAFLNPPKVERNFDTIKIGLSIDRDDLYERIDQRMDEMIDKGLFKEAMELYPYRDLYSLQTLGYSEIFDFIEGKYDKAEAIRLLKRNSRRYAKRQITWFKRDSEISWFHPDQKEEIVKRIETKLKE